MNPDKNTIDKKSKEETVDKKSTDAIETPPPPQHMDPSKTPKEAKNISEKKTKK